MGLKFENLTGDTRPVREEALSGSLLLVFLWVRYIVDCRLNRFNEVRLERITKIDLPELARAIVAFQRKQCKAASGSSRNVPYIRLFGDGVNVIIREDDWKLVVPFLLDGTLDPLLTPLNQIIELHQSVQYNPSLQSTRDSEFNSRVLNLLEKLFLVDIPTSNL